MQRRYFMFVAALLAVDPSGSGVGTLLIDLVDGIVVRMRLEP